MPAMILRPFCLALVLAATLAWPVHALPRCAEEADSAACVWGRVEAVEGGALTVRGLPVTLAGIHAPSRRDVCASRSTGRTFDCARPARKRMTELTAKGVTCDIVDVAGGALIGQCRVAEGDLALLLVQSGVVRGRDPIYEEANAAARTAHKGLWDPDVLAPRDWQAGRGKGRGRERDEEPPPSDAAAQPSTPPPAGETKGTAPKPN
ncbi:MAG: thermonuclease family protein [Rhodospirillales bacterium]|nr:thermonuclease family protein [Rhodospirillales bacterium]